MKSFNEVLENSKNALLEQRKEQIQRDKVAIVEALKVDYGIPAERKINSYPKNVQEMVLNQLLEFWSPKTGINHAGRKYLVEGAFAIDKNSTPENIKLYAQKSVKANIEFFTEAFKESRGREATYKLFENIKQKTAKKVNLDSLFECVYEIVQEHIKMMNS